MVSEDRQEPAGRELWRIPVYRRMYVWVGMQRVLKQEEEERETYTSPPESRSRGT